MIELISRHKIAVVVIGVVIAVVSWAALSEGPTSSSLLTTEVTADGGDTELVTTLLALRAVKLDGTIFTDPSFTSLKDFSTEIVPEPIGRPNPFAPLGSTVVPTASSTRGAQIFAPVSSGKKPPAPLQ